METNLFRFKQLRDRNTNIQLQVCTTVNVFNVLYLEDVANWIDRQGFDIVYCNMMHEAYYFSISTLPDSVKPAVVSKLSTADVSERTRKEFDNIIDFMNRGLSLDGQELREQIKKIDLRRNENLVTVAPEFANIINYV